MALNLSNNSSKTPTTEVMDVDTWDGSLSSSFERMFFRRGGQNTGGLEMDWRQRYLCLGFDPYYSLARTGRQLIVPLVRLGKLSDAAKTVVEQNGLDAGRLETQLAEMEIVCVVPLVLECVPGGFATFQVVELGQLRGRTMAGERVASVVQEGVASGF